MDQMIMIMTTQIDTHDHPPKNGVDHYGDHGVITFFLPIDAEGERAF